MPELSAAARWYGSCQDELVSAMWCGTEIASALSIKQRTKQICEGDAQAQGMATLDAVLAKNAKRMKLKLAVHGT